MDRSQPVNHQCPHDGFSSSSCSMMMRHPHLITLAVDARILSLHLQQSLAPLFVFRTKAPQHLTLNGELVSSASSNTSTSSLHQVRKSNMSLKHVRLYHPQQVNRGSTTAAHNLPTSSLFGFKWEQLKDLTVFGANHPDASMLKPICHSRWRHDDIESKKRRVHGGLEHAPIPSSHVAALGCSGYGSTTN
eukprot:scaffold523_cov166-Amphora_coffeaeformis.AAC.7